MRKGSSTIRVRDATRAPARRRWLEPRTRCWWCAGPGDFYYRGVRLTDGASIELANAVRSSGGFDVTNPTDGTRYQIRPDGLTIIPPDGQAITEPMVEYAAS